jgi:coenzyme F420-0:L-glutamate ligase/coenzyme F420-1:gamma-L-glutamate ligase
MSTAAPSLVLTALPGIPLVQPGDDLARLTLDGLDRAGIALTAGDALVITSKIVAKAEGRQVDLTTVVPSVRAHEIATVTGKDPRIVELILHESVEISRMAPGVLIVRHRLGFISANAGIDQSNVDGSDDSALLLPVDPDASAEALRARLCAATGVNVGIVISDSHGRPFRLGNVGVAIGAAGLPALRDLRGTQDLHGRLLQISIQGYADMIASAAGLLTGEGAEGLPIIHVRGLRFEPTDGHAADLVRPPEHDLYRSAP